MAHILTESTATTLRQALTRYYRLVLGVAFLMNLAATIFYLGSVQSYSNTMKKVLSLNEYYVQFEKVNGELSDYISSGTETAEKRLNDSMQVLQAAMEGLKTMGVSREFQRDIADAAAMMEKYEEKAGIIIEKMSANNSKLTSAVYGDILAMYEEAMDIYERIDAEFKPLHLQLLSFASSRQDAFMKKSRMYYSAFLLLMLVLGLYGSVHGKRLGDRIVAPIQALTRSAEDIHDGKLFEFREIHFQESVYKEIAILANVFNMMAQQIKEQIRIIEEDAKTKAALREHEVEKLKILNLLRTSELKSLQMQMNPHFLFNTLNMIAKTAYIEDAGKTVFLLQKTAQLLRYSLDYMGKSVTLAREMESLGNYVYLQEQRFGKRIHFIFDLDERFHQTQIPCLILQPLVENSIIHGVGAAVEGGKIIIQTRYNPETEKVVIRITDNGAGIEEEALQTIRDNLHSDKEQREKLGLANVYQRLKIFFGDQMTMEILSKPEEGTTIQISIPTEDKWREEKHVENVNCR